MEHLVACICWNLIQQLQTLFPYWTAKLSFPSITDFYNYLVCFRDKHPTNWNIFNLLRTPQISLELKTMNSEPQIILQPLVGDHISSLGTNINWELTWVLICLLIHFSSLKAAIHQLPQPFLLVQFDIQSLAK